LIEKECCPNFSDRGKCGEQNGRGECRELSTVDHTTNVRDGWPYYFTRVCMCAGNYSGYDCGRCKYGYYGEDCSYCNFNVMERRSISEFSPDDWKKYVDILNKSKMHNSDYMVFLREPEQKPYDIPQLQPILL
jgi:tyrosinase